MPTLTSSPLPSPLLIPAVPRYQAPRPKWRARVEIEPSDRALASRLDISPVTAAILRARGYQDDRAVEAFFAPDRELLHDPGSLPDIELIVARLIRAIQSGERILIFGDYDVDGITSTALLLRTLRKLGALVDYRLPERHEGYGLSVETIETAKLAGFSLVMTADCGITAVEPAKRAREIGIDLVITDHHECGQEIPDALAVVNPKRPDSSYPFLGLSGCGVAFKVMQALILAYQPKALASFEAKFLDLVALSTIADCVPLCDENRYLAFAGLEQLYGTRKRGLRALIENAQIRDKGFYIGRDVSFGLAPRINAAGRLDSPTLALRLLLSDDDDECRALAAQMEELNQTRRSRTDVAVQEAEHIVEKQANLGSDRLLIAAGTGWHRGVVGLIAAKLVDKYHRPAFALNIDGDHAHGSGRSCADFDLHALIEATRVHLTSGGGHAAACGLSLQSKNVEPFRADALGHAAEKLSMEDLVPSALADCETSGRDVTLQLARELGRLEPCGTGNEAPTLLLSNVELGSMWPLGESGLHLKGRVNADGRSLEWVWWRGGPRVEEFRRGVRVDCLFVPEINEYRGETKLQLSIKDMRAAA